jgi:hypothetical protein
MFLSFFSFIQHFVVFFRQSRTLRKHNKNKRKKSVGYHEFGVGDTVKLFNSKKEAKKEIVLEENYLVPYEIINKIINITRKKCSLKCTMSGKVLKANQNINNIKHFKKESGN